MNSGELWFEKYRPHSLNEMILPEEYKTRFVEFLSSKHIPHLLLYGPAGSGKTSLARIFLSSLNVDVLEMNASDERGIDTVRSRIKSFVSMQSLKEGKIVFLDEADALTPDAQFALRNLMEKFSKGSRFILTANYENKIIDPIKSRCTGFVFDTLPVKAVIKTTQHILKKENVEIKDMEELIMLVQDYYPDIRTIINQLQYNSISGEFSYTLKSEKYGQFITLLNTKNLKGIREQLSRSTPFVELYRYLFQHIKELQIPAEQAPNALIHIAEYLYRDTFVPDKEINFSACCLEIMRLIQGE